MPYWESRWDDSLFFLLCRHGFRQAGNRILNMAKASGAAGAVFMPNPKARLFDQVRDVLRFHHYALRTEEAYLQWIKRYLVFHRASSSTGSARPLLRKG